MVKIKVIMLEDVCKAMNIAIFEYRILPPGKHRVFFNSFRKYRDTASYVGSKNGNIQLKNLDIFFTFAKNNTEFGYAFTHTHTHAHAHAHAQRERERERGRESETANHGQFCLLLFVFRLNVPVNH